MAPAAAATASPRVVHLSPRNPSSSGSKAAAAGGGGSAPSFDLSALKAIIDESIASAVTAATAPLHQELGAVKQRLTDAESRASSEADDEGDDDDEESVESGISELLNDEKTYLAIDPRSNPHYGAADIANGGDFKPKRHELYGHKPWMVLTKNGNDTGGILGLALSYAEPLSLFGKATVAASEHLADEFAEGIDDPEAFLQDLVALRNSCREIYGLANLFRSILVQKARALRSGATEFDKQEVKFLERALHERDFSTADTAAEIANLRALFAKKTSKADLERLSKKASGSGGGGGTDLSDGGSESGSDASDKRRSRNKRKREKAKERKKRAKGKDSNGRDVGGGGGKSTSARRDGSGSGDSGGRSSSRPAPSAAGGKRGDTSGRGKSGQGKSSRNPPSASRSEASDDDAGFE